MMAGPACRTETANRGPRTSATGPARVDISATWPGAKVMRFPLALVWRRRLNELLDLERRETAASCHAAIVCQKQHAGADERLFGQNAVDNLVIGSRPSHVVRRVREQRHFDHPISLRALAGRKARLSMRIFEELINLGEGMPCTTALVGLGPALLGVELINH